MDVQVLTQATTETEQQDTTASLTTVRIDTITIITEVRTWEDHTEGFNTESLLIIIIHKDKNDK